MSSVKDVLGMDEKEWIDSVLNIESEEPSTNSGPSIEDQINDFKNSHSTEEDGTNILRDAKKVLT